MSGNVENAAVWEDADVLVADITAAIPAEGEDFSSDWDAVGLLDGSAGFVEKAGMQMKDFYAWGSKLVATSRNQ